MTYRFRSVALIGIDGSGKTTQATLLCERLRRDGMRAIYAHPYGHPLLRLVFQRSFSGGGAPADRRAGPSCRALLALMELLEAITYLWALHLGCMLLATVGRRIVWLVSDRSIDSLLAKHAWRNSLPPALLHALYRMSPRCETKLWLRIPPQVAAQRDFDFAPGAYREMDEAHAAVSQRLGWIEIPCDELPANVLLERILEHARVRDLPPRNQDGRLGGVASHPGSRAGRGVGHAGALECVESPSPVSPEPHPALARAFASLDEARLAWCLLRPPVNLAAPSGDLDILVESGALPRVRQVLGRQGFARRTVWGRPEAFFLAFDRRDNIWITLHVSEQLDFGAQHALHAGVADECLARSERVGSVRVLCRDDMFWMLLFHTLLDKGKIAPRYHGPIRDLATRSSLESPLAMVIGRYCPAGWSPERLLQDAIDANWPHLESVISALSMTWVARQPRPDAKLAWERIASRLAGPMSAVSSSGPLRRLGRAFVRRRIMLRSREPMPAPDSIAETCQLHEPGVRHRRGVTVALLGPDGVGKSTIAASIAATAPDQVRYVYMGLGPRHSPRIAAIRVSALRLGLYALILWRRYLVARWHRARGRIVIFDRYTYDAVRMVAQRGWRQRMKRSVWLHLCPAPDIVVVLDAPGTVIRARKAENSLDHLERDRRQFLALKELRANVWIVDATRSPDLVRDDVLNLIQQVRHAGSGMPST